MLGWGRAVLSILIVDDSAAIRRSLCGLLAEQPDWNVVGQAENGLEAIEKAQQLRPELIVLDLSMPIMNGLEAARELRKILPSTQILMLTNHALDGLRGAAMAAGVQAVHSKDAVNELVPRIRTLLSSVA
jgi:DNA-binding NarL/FixJ family response regulator